MTLYEIDERLSMLEEEMTDSTTGEYIDDEERLFALIDDVKMDLATKIENTICFSKNLEAEVEAFKAEEKRLKARRESKEKLAENLKKKIDTYIRYQCTDENGVLDVEKLNKYKMETPKMKISYRKSTGVEVTDLDKLDAEYKRTVIEEKADKTKIKKDIQKGKEIDGAKLVTNYNMSIK